MSGIRCNDVYSDIWITAFENVPLDTWDQAPRFENFFMLNSAEPENFLC